MIRDTAKLCIYFSSNNLSLSEGIYALQPSPFGLTTGKAYIEFSCLFYGSNYGRTYNGASIDGKLYVTKLSNEHIRIVFDSVNVTRHYTYYDGEFPLNDKTGLDTSKVSGGITY